jgi:uncharacterized protein with PQ loop repeat
MAELAAILATVVAAVAAVPQLRRVVVGADGLGVSLSAALLGVVNETVWIAYAVHEHLWAALPEAVLMATSNVVLVVWLLRAGAGGSHRAARAAGLWAAVLATVVVVGGTHALALALGAAYAVQVAPAVWTAWRTPSPSGVAGATWTMILVESSLWMFYGLHHDDPATTALGVVGIVAGTAMVARKGVTRRRRASLAF